MQKAGFLAKERERFTFTYNLKFNSGIIYLKNDGITLTLTQERQCKNLKLICNENATIISNKGILR